MNTLGVMACIYGVANHANVVYYGTKVTLYHHIRGELMARQKRTKAAGISPDLTPEKAALIKGMLARGDRQSDVAAYFQINQGRIYEIKFGQKFANVQPAPAYALPPKGPYVVVSKIVYERAKLSEDVLNKVSAIMEQALADMRVRLDQALAQEG